jgi:hypothetical protein
MALDLSTVVSELQVAQLLTLDGGMFRFKYKYIYCYFVARYFQESIANASDQTPLRQELFSIADRIYYEDFANIIIFVLYLTKDRALIAHILQNASEVYKECEPFNFVSHVAFLNTIGTSDETLRLPESSVKINREEYYKKKDADARSVPVKSQELTDKDVVYTPDLDPLRKLAIALRTIAIMGQILRNFPGVLHKEVKSALAKESYELGLRTLRHVLVAIETQLPQLEGHYAELLREKMPLDPENKVQAAADDLIFHISKQVGFGITRRVSQAVGLPELVETYRSVREDASNQLSYDMFDISIKLDHFNEFPEAEIVRTAASIKGNHYTGAILRDLVANHIYLFHTEYRTRQSMGNLFKLQFLSPGSTLANRKNKRGK